MNTSLITLILSFLCYITPITAQTNAPKEIVTKPTTNDIVHETMDHIKSIFIITATAKTVDSAKKSVVNIKDTTNKIIALKTILEASPMPTVSEKKLFAKKMVQYESEVVLIIKKMTNTFQTNSEKVNAIIQPAITEFKTKTTPVTNLINSYYPQEEMRGYMEQLKGK